MSGFLILIIVLIAATAFGLWRRATDGRMRTLTEPVPMSEDEAGEVVHDAPHAEHGGDVLTAAAIGSNLGEVATLVQFSSAFCQPCRATRTILGEVVEMVPGVTHVEIDAEAHLDLVRALDIRRTPTVLVLDKRGAIRKRASGAPRKADVIAALGELA